MVKTEINTSKIEEELVYFLQTKIHMCSLENTSFLSKNSIKNIVITEDNHVKNNLKFNQTKTLINLIKNIDSQDIINILIKFLDTPKTSKMYILKIPKSLRESKYKIYFWMLFFCHENLEDFQLGLHKLIKEISKEYSKKTVFEILNFGVILSKIKAEKRGLFNPSISVNGSDKKKSVTHFNYN
ncbi:hypothetical protein [Marixanthomonas ophiurae]|uniref:Uncharacterized protein n=1 Tax=Marixanthomonas ophiurae TaxID=387659 RepID=A0A3E1Q6Z2_9FLAO|nr:hypothetical protein [Marixanthomonas ophiurae]RFN57907.1 hypothetical protein DZ858_11725 [Marixanthomonas ophiurae]